MAKKTNAQLKEEIAVLNDSIAELEAKAAKAIAPPQSPEKMKPSIATVDSDGNVNYYNAPVFRVKTLAKQISRQLKLKEPETGQ